MHIVNIIISFIIYSNVFKCIQYFNDLLFKKTIYNFKLWLSILIIIFYYLIIIAFDLQNKNPVNLK